MRKEKACKNCRMLTFESTCPNCNSTELSEDWSGLVIVRDPVESKVANKLGIKKPGKYAIFVV